MNICKVCKKPIITITPNILKEHMDCIIKSLESVWNELDQVDLDFEPIITNEEGNNILIDKMIEISEIGEQFDIIHNNPFELQDLKQIQDFFNSIMNEVKNTDGIEAVRKWNKFTLFMNYLADMSKVGASLIEKH